jgi:inhibitor of cysteine peptidase
MKKKISKYLILVMMMSILVLSACQSLPIENPGLDDPVSKTPATDFLESKQNVFVDDLQILIMESFPVQVRVIVTGNLPDGCTSIISSKADMIDDTTFVLSIFTERPEDMMCTMALVPFEESISLDVHGLSAGTYSVKGFDLEESFTLDVDNK